MRVPALTWLLCLFPILLVTGCSTVSERAEEARSILKSEKVLVMLSPSIPHPEMPFSVGSSFEIAYGEDVIYTKGQSIIDTYGVTDPLSGVRDNFLQSLPGGIIQGKILYEPISSVDLQRFDGWVIFSTFAWQLQGGPLVEYRFGYWVRAKILHNSGMTDKHGRIFMETLWQADCKINKPGVFKGYPLSTWLENDATLLKETIANLQKPCGQEIAQDILEFLEN